MNVTVLVELGCVCATADAAVSSKHTPKKDKALMVFIGSLLKNQLSSMYDQEILRSSMPQTEAGAHGDENALGICSREMLHRSRRKSRMNSSAKQYQPGIFVPVGLSSLAFPARSR
jgi:hypothetical protein